MVWDFLVSPDLEHAAIWWTEGNAAKRELEAVQERMGRILLRTSITGQQEVTWAGESWRRDEKRKRLGKGSTNIEDSTLVKT